jgi:hypothetical protein
MKRRRKSQVMKEKVKNTLKEQISWAPVVMPVMPATQEAEIRKSTVQSQPGQTVLEILS